jgi:tellurite resistance protein TerC
MWYWTGLALFLLIFLSLDLFMHRKEHRVEIREALFWSGIWIFVGLLFNVGIYYTKGTEAALNFFAGYLVEKSLSVDNLFVFLLIFSYFKTPPRYTHMVLFWGVLGAILMRGIFIFFGLALIESFEWIFYLFGLFLIITGIRLGWKQETDIDPENNFVVRSFKKFFPYTHDYHDGHFFIKKGTKFVATPLFITLLAVEFSDLVFAVDSIPAIMGITLDPFIVYSSNIFAILGLRALYFALSGMMELFHYLKYALSLILCFIGLKMLIKDFLHIPIWGTLGFITTSLAIATIASYLDDKKPLKQRIK